MAMSLIKPKSLDSSTFQTTKRKSFWFRRWKLLDVWTLGFVVAVHFLSLLAPFYFNWSSVCLALAVHVVTGLLGITLCYHRTLAHKSLQLPKWLEYLFAYCGVQALQRDPIFWVGIHRLHHQYSDKERDPHSPNEGFFFSHIGWIMHADYYKEKFQGLNNVEDLKKQPFYRFLRRTYLFHPLAFGVVLYAVGGLPFLTWVMGVRILLESHFTYFVNSVCHVWGEKAWATPNRDNSRNNWWVAMVTYGEGWHNNHHAFEYSARHGLEWWQIDMTWYVIRFLVLLGLATHVKLPTDFQMKKMALNK